MFLPPLGRQLWKVLGTALVRKLVKFYFMFRSLAKAPFFIALVFWSCFVYLLFLVFCRPFTLRRVHTCQQVLAISFTIHSLLSFQKACCHSAASAFGGCTRIKASFFVVSTTYFITFIFHFCCPNIHLSFIGRCKG